MFIVSIAEKEVPMQLLLEAARFFLLRGLLVQDPMCYHATRAAVTTLPVLIRTEKAYSVEQPNAMSMI